MRIRCWLILNLGLAMALSGCMVAAFLQTDPDFQPHPGQADPKLYLDRLPAEDLWPVGIIEVKLGSNYDINDVVNEVLARGRALGCHSIIDRAIFVPRQETGALGESSWRVVPAQYPVPPYQALPPRYMPVPPPSVFQFVCLIKKTPMVAPEKANQT